MFEIIIKNLRLFGYHGVNKEEKTIGQEFLFNISIFLACAGIKKEELLKKDSIKNTVDYSGIIKMIKDINNSNKFDLLETLSAVIAENIISFSPIIEKVSVRVEKTSPPVQEKIGSVGVGIQVNKQNRVKSFLALGSNLGDREKNLRDAVHKIGQDPRIDVINISSIYETEPMYVRDQESFYNIVIEISVDDTLDAFKTLGHLKGIEFSMGRTGNVPRYGPRVIDIDILYFGNIEIASDFLTVPHPKIKERKFVLIPLKEIAPGLLIKGRSVKELAGNRKLMEKVNKVKNW